MSTQEPFPEIRYVTGDTLEDDLVAKRIDVHPAIAEGLREEIGKGIDFVVATTMDGDSRGQIGVNWNGPIKQENRDALGLMPGECVPNIAFLEVPEDHRRRGIARALLRTVIDRAEERGNSRVFLSVVTDNDGAKALYTSMDFVDIDTPSETLQFNRNPDGSYGDPVYAQTDLMVRAI